ncbi:hypothetical protein SK128_028423 [Halocaridina rubra]|uniref:Uncharacterized protein n=1 Tax=Halocaridina rubra TaxID=373956 RepID=A0AAN8WC84_HALRR
MLDACWITEESRPREGSPRRRYPIMTTSLTSSTATTTSATLEELESLENGSVFRDVRRGYMRRYMSVNRVDSSGGGEVILDKRRSVHESVHSPPQDHEIERGKSRGGRRPIRPTSLPLVVSSTPTSPKLSPSSPSANWKYEVSAFYRMKLFPSKVLTDSTSKHNHRLVY